MKQLVELMLQITMCRYNLPLRYCTYRRRIENALQVRIASGAWILVGEAGQQVSLKNYLRATKASPSSILQIPRAIYWSL